MHEFQELKSKLDAAGVDTSELFAKKICRRHRGTAEPPQYPIFCIPTRLDNAMSLWQKLSDISTETGYCPVLDDDDEFDWEAERWDEVSEEPIFADWDEVRQEIDERIRSAEEFDADAWFEQELIEARNDSKDPAKQRHFIDWIEAVKQQYKDPRVKEALEKRHAECEKLVPGFMQQVRNSDDILRKLLYGIDTDPNVDTLMSQMQAQEGARWDLSETPWPDVAPSNTILALVPLKREPMLAAKRAYIDLLPVRFSWQLPALDFFPPANNYWGGAQFIHMAILKKWHTEYGADLIVMSGATYELTVDRPPTTKANALKLAVEQYLYCVDCVTQSSLPATIKHRAASLLNAKAWHFWWD